MELEAARRRPHISLTPLIDVVFLLLVFFMLATSYLDLRAVVLETPAAAEGGAGWDGVLLVRLRDGGRIEAGGQTVSLAGLEHALRGMLERSEVRRVVIQAEDKVPLQRIVSVLEATQAAGAASVALRRGRR